LAFTADLREMKKLQASITNDIENLKKLKAELQEKSVCLYYDGGFHPLGQQPIPD
jgi:hypothetical protein